MKSESAYRTIAEVSDILSVPAHVLRFWETQFYQLKPVKRVGGRRYYRADDISLLTQIRNYLYTDGYTIKGVQKVLKNKAKDEEVIVPVNPESALQSPAGITPVKAVPSTLIDELKDIKEYLKQFV